MADVGNSARCNETCGCPSPCPGGGGCRCVPVSGGSNMQQAYCKCGEHCACNPCTCTKYTSSDTGKASCTCASGCKCDKL